MLLQEGLAALNAIQRKWLYLEPIFSRGALPGQQGRFRAVDAELRAVMAHLHVSCCFHLVWCFMCIPMCSVLNSLGAWNWDV